METAVVGRKAVSSSAVDKLKKKRRKKRKIKEGKRSSASSASATGSPEFDGTQVHKTRSTYSCPPEIKQTTLPLQNKPAQETDEIQYNESLRWLPLIVAHSAALPPTSSSSLYSATNADRLASNPLEESGEEKEERLAIYKMNRRKRYLAAQQALLDLYPDNNVYAGPSSEHDRHLPNSTSIYSSSSSSTPQESSRGGYNKFQMAVSPLNRESSLPQEVA